MNTATATLNSFVRKECANFDKNRGECIYGYKCLVLKGERCLYFEKAVLGEPDYKFRTPGYNYKTIFKQYAEIRKELRGELHKLNVNKCNECGEAIPPRFSYCEKCGNRRKRHAQRQRIRKHRCNAFVGNMTN